MDARLQIRTAIFDCDSHGNELLVFEIAIIARFSGQRNRGLGLRCRRPGRSQQQEEAEGQTNEQLRRALEVQPNLPIVIFITPMDYTPAEFLLQDLHSREQVSFFFRNPVLCAVIPKAQLPDRWTQTTDPNAQ